MRTPLQRIRLGAIVLAAILVIAVLGYHWLDENDSDWLDDIYMVVITISSVGFGETSNFDWTHQLFTIAVVIFGMSAAVYTIGGFFQMMTEGEIEKALGVRRRTREIDRLKDHAVVCGFGRIGRTITSELKRQGVSFVVLDKEPHRLDNAQNQGCLVVKGDATQEGILVEAGVERAKSLISTLPDDASNVFITLTARILNQNLRIVARAEYAETEKKLIQAGADSVVLPATMSGQRMARMITRPSTVELLELISDRSLEEMDLDELVIGARSDMAGKSVGELATRSRHGLLIVAIKRADGHMLFNPDSDCAFEPDDTLIVLGRAKDIEQFRGHHSIE